MKPLRTFSLVAVTAACAIGTVPAAAAAAGSDVAQATSENWSGYVAGASSDASSTKFKSVSGSWVVPSAKCSSGSTYSAFWVGLGGAGSTQALEQAGSEANCSATGSASYYAWYELVPKAPVRVSLAVKPGDHMTTKVTVEGSTVDIDVSDTTTGQSFSKTLSMSNPDTSSAEWIAEAPSACDATVSSCQPLPLTDFGSVDFTSASATSSTGHTGSISDPDWSATAVSLTPDASGMGFSGGVSYTGSESSSGSATPSSLSSDGSSFSVAYAAGDTSASSGSSGGGGTSGDGGTSGYGYGGGGWSYGYGSGGWSGGYGGGGWSGGYGDGGYPGGYGYPGSGYAY